MFVEFKKVGVTIKFRRPKGIYPWYVALSVLLITGLITLMLNPMLGRAADYAQTSALSVTAAPASSRLGEGGVSGEGLAVNGDYMVATGRQYSGGQDEARVFHRVGGAWEFMQTLHSSDWASGDLFGQAVAISGTTIVIGAKGDTNGAIPSAGSVYVFDLDTGVWLQTQKLISATLNADSARFGASVDIDGDRLVVGAPGFGNNNVNNGKGAISVWSRSGLTWGSEQTATFPASTIFEKIGQNVEIEGTKVSAGSTAANMYTWTYNTTLTGQTALSRTGASGGTYTGSTVMKGNWLAAISSGDGSASGYSVFIYEYTGGTWVQRQRITTVVALTLAFADGTNQLLVGNSGFDIAGTTYGAFSEGQVVRFEYSGGTYSQIQVFPTTRDTHNSQNFGASMAGEGQNFYISSPYSAASSNDAASAGNILTYGLADATPPSVVLTTTAPNPTNAAFEVTFTFSEAVSGFSAGDIVVTEGGVTTAGDVSGFIVDSPTVYRATITPATLVNAVINVTSPAGAAADPAANQSLVGTLNANYDPSRPGVTLAFANGAQSNPTNSSVVSMVATFTEAVSGFTLSDINVSNGTASNFVASSASTYTFDVTRPTDGALSASVAQNLAVDTATNQNTASNSLGITFDRTGPVPTASTIKNPTNVSPFTVIFTYDTPITAFDSSRLSISGGTISGSSIVNQTVEVIITPSAPGDIVVTAGAGLVHDVAGNASSASSPFTVTYDIFGPTVIVTPPSSPNKNSPLQFTIDFSENVTGFTQSDLTLAGGSASNFTQVNPGKYTVDITPSFAQGTVSVTVPFGAAQDAATNDNQASLMASVEYDSVKPGATLQSGTTSPTNSSQIPITATFTEPVTGVTAGDFTLTNVTISNFQAVSSTVYTFDASPVAQGSVSVQLPANKAQDIAGNDNTASNSINLQYETVSPTAVITSSASSPTVTSPIPITITFSEAVAANVSGSDIIITNGTANAPTLSGDGLRITSLVTPTTNGVVTVRLNAAATSDPAGNPNIQSNLFSITYDPHPIGVQIDPEVSSPTNGNPIPFLVTFSAAPLSFTASNITSSNGTVQSVSSVSSTQYRVQIIPSVLSGVITVQVPTNQVVDAAGNNNPASNIASVTYDGIKPVSALSSAPGSPTKQNTTVVTISFTEAVSGFTQSDLTTSGGTLSGFTSDSTTTYHVTLAMPSDATYVVDLFANSVSDTAGNQNNANNIHIIRDTVSPTGTVTPGTFITSKPAVTGTVNDPSATVTLSIDNQTVACINNGDGTWTVDVNSYGSVLQNGTYVAAATFTDIATNFSVSSPSNIVVNAFLVTPTISSISGDPTSNNPIPIIIDFDASVTGFTSSSLQLTNATIQNFAGTGASYTAQLVPSGQGKVTADILASIVTDAGGHANRSAHFERVYDNIAPGIVLSAGTTPTNSNFVVTMIINEDQTSGFDISDIVVSNGTASNFIALPGGRNFTVTISPTSGGAVTVRVPALALQDSALNQSTASNVISRIYDATAPNAPTVNAQTTFSRTPIITGTYDAADFGTINVTVSGATYSSVPGSSLSASGGTWSLDLSSLLTPLKIETYDIQATQYDEAGNTASDTTTNELVIQPYAGINGTVDLLITADTTPSLSGEVDDPNAMVAVTVGGQTHTAINNHDGSWTLADNVFSPALNSGTYDVVLLLTDGPRSGVDQTRNELTINALAPRGTFSRIETADTTPRLFGTVDDPSAIVTIYLLDKTYTPTNNGDLSWVLADNSIQPPLDPGKYVVALRLTDNLGNEAVTVVRSAIHILGVSTIVPPDTPPGAIKNLPDGLTRFVSSSSAGLELSPLPVSADTDVVKTSPVERHQNTVKILGVSFVKSTVVVFLIAQSGLASFFLFLKHIHDKHLKERIAKHSAALAKKIRARTSGRIDKNMLQ